MAEALVELADPLSALLQPGPELPLEVVTRSLAASVAPIEADVAPPAWLFPEQIAPFRRTLAALDRHGGALLADPVGSGKTWIALAIAAALGGRAVAIVPAALREQWRRTAQAAGVAVSLHTHEALSRGRVPEGRPRLVIVDESHRFRTPGTRRYRAVAPWVLGKTVLLLSATPVVNRLADLAHQLRLGIRDDALAARGVPNLLRLLENGESSAPLGDLVLCRPRPPERPSVRPDVLRWAVDDTDREVLEAIDTLQLSRNRATRALIRMVLWRALGSSRAALMQTLRRYQSLLEHAREAATIGKVVSRSEIRSFTLGELDQLVMWEVLPSLHAPADLILEDQQAIERLIGQLRGTGVDQRALALQGLLCDGRITLVFTTSRDTLELLRSSLSEIRPAWVTGSAAGIGHVRLEREMVLDLFRPASGGSQPAAGDGRVPTVLLATDVAAEGLDLQRAERIVHFDLPWTSVRLDQREGRAVRMGSTREEVEVVRLAPWPELEEKLQQDARLVAKRRLASSAGLDESGRWLFRWRAEVAEGAQGAAVQSGMAMVEGLKEGWLIGLALDLVFPDGRRRREPASLFWVTDSGECVDDAKLISARLAEIDAARQRPVTRSDRDRAGEILLTVARARLALAQESSWLAREAAPEQRSLARRIRTLVARAAATRDRRLLELGDRALDWLAGGVTAGEEALMRELLECSLERIPVRWRPLLQRPRERPVPSPRLTGIIGVSKFRACQPSTPCCSTSTAR